MPNFSSKSLKDYCKEYGLDYDKACKLRRKGMNHEDIKNTLNK